MAKVPALNSHVTFALHMYYGTGTIESVDKTLSKKSKETLVDSAAFESISPSLPFVGSYMFIARLHFRGGLSGDE